jgi:ribosome-binding ATPase YchF (GTP1/OBG family)
MTIKVGLIGKTNTGKTTLFNSATLLNAEISTYPFTTKQPNAGTAYVQTLCVCRELGVKDNPRNSACIDGWRFIPIELIDLPGLIKDAWMGKGLGNQFLSVAVQSNVLLHVVDASGSVDAEGKLSKPGTGDPVQDVYDVEEEMIKWFSKILEGNRKRIIKRLQASKLSLDWVLYKTLAGLAVKREDITTALKSTQLSTKNFEKWTAEDLKAFVWEIRKLSKPTIIVANKMDLPYAEENYQRLVEEFKGVLVVPCCAEAELALRRAEQRGFVSYIPGEETFRVLDETKLSPQQLRALKYVDNRIFAKWMRTGVQFALNLAVFKLLRMNTVYPVDNAEKFSDKAGNVLPDALLVPYDATVYDLAKEIHTELAKTMIYAIDARTGVRLPKDCVVKDRDIIKIVAVKERK